MLIRNAINRYKLFQFKKSLKSLGTNPQIHKSTRFKNPQYISIGDNVFIARESRIEAWNEYAGIHFNPIINIGDNVLINEGCHIGSINMIKIGKDCLLGSHVMLIDHSHGMNTIEELDLHPSQRKLFSKGPINIGERVWICENAVILPNVNIGDSAIIAANAVVTKDVPPNCIVAGNPAKVVKQIKA